MKYWIFVHITLWLLQLHCMRADKKMVDAFKIVEYINKNTRLPWKADTYGSTQVDVKLFVRNKMGLILPSSRNFTKSNPRSLIKKATLKPGTDGTGLPEEFTWVNKKDVNCPINHIRDQSNCGSCWAVATAAAFGDRVCIQSKGKYNVTLSQEYITACDTRNYGCSGGYFQHVNNFLLINGTITGGDYDSDDGCQPYTIRPCGFPSSSKMPCEHHRSRTPVCRAKKCNNDWYSYTHEPDSNVFKVKSWYFVKENSTFSQEDRIRDEIYRNGPLVAGFWIVEDLLFYKKGVYVPTPRGWIMGGHAVRVVGWGIENGLKYWHAANSWGPEWGEGGYFKMIRGVNALSFESSSSALIPDL